jgi:hypothetical protein
MDCEAARAQLADRLTGELDADAQARLDEHLRTCAACAKEAASIEGTWALLAEIPAAPADSAAMRSRLDAALHGRERTAPRWWYMPGLQAAAAVLLVAFGFLAGRETMRPKGEDPAISELRQELRDTRQLASLSLLQQGSASERLRGVSYTSSIEQPGNEVLNALLDTLLHDSNENVRLKTVEALKRFSDRPNVRRAATEALTGPAASPLVQIELINFLVEANDRDAVPSLQRVSQDTMLNEAVRKHAAWGLQHIG